MSKSIGLLILGFVLVATAPAGVQAIEAQVAQAPAAQQGTASGTVNAIDVGKGVINLTHDPIPSLGWPAMTMDFGVAPEVSLAGLAKGAKVSFTVVKGADGIFRIVAINPAGK